MCVCVCVCVCGVGWGGVGWGGGGQLKFQGGQVPPAWAIWNARNKICFEKFQRHLENILREATGFLQEYQRLNAARFPGG